MGKKHVDDVEANLPIRPTKKKQILQSSNFYGTGDQLHPVLWKWMGLVILRLHVVNLHV